MSLPPTCFFSSLQYLGSWRISGVTVKCESFSHSVWLEEKVLLIALWLTQVKFTQPIDPKQFYPNTSLIENLPFSSHGLSLILRFAYPFLPMPNMVKHYFLDI